MPASLWAHSAKNGISVPSAILAAKNRNIATRPGAGVARMVSRVEVRNLKRLLTCQLHASGPNHLRCADGGGDALADVNAYDVRGTRNEHLGQQAGPHKSSWDFGYD